MWVAEHCGYDVEDIGVDWRVRNMASGNLITVFDNLATEFFALLLRQQDAEILARIMNDPSEKKDTENLN